MRWDGCLWNEFPVKIADRIVSTHPPHQYLRWLQEVSQEQVRCLSIPQHGKQTTLEKYFPTLVMVLLTPRLHHHPPHAHGQSQAPHPRVRGAHPHSPTLES